MADVENSISNLNLELSVLSDERITTEILVYKNQVGQGIIEIGKRLIEMKKRIGHGNWENYLRDKVDFSDRTARRFMSIAEEYANRPSMSVLGVNKLYALLDVPAEEREEFIESKHEIDGIEKTVDEMTTRELHKVIKEKEELERRNQELQKFADNQTEKVGFLYDQLEHRINEFNIVVMELQKEQNRKQEVVETVVEKVVEVVPPTLKRDIEQKQLTIDNLTQSVIFNENEVRKIQAELTKLKKDNAELSQLKQKEHEIQQFQDKLDKLKRDHSSVVKQMDEEVKIFKSLEKVKEVIKDELLYIPTLTVHNNNTETMKKEIKNLVELLDNLKYAFINKFGV